MKRNDIFCGAARGCFDWKVISIIQIAALPQLLAINTEKCRNKQWQRRYRDFRSPEWFQSNNLSQLFGAPFLDS